MHQNSLLAFSEEGPRLSKRERAIMCVFGLYPTLSLSDRVIMEQLKYSDMNSVRPRITELVKAGWLQECGTTTDHVTGKRVRLVRLKKSAPLEYPD